MNSNSKAGGGEACDSVHLLEKLMVALEKTQRECESSVESSSTTSIMIRDNFQGVMSEIESIAKLIDSIPGADTTEEEQKENLRAAVQALRDQEAKFKALFQSDEN